jgi:tetratricopeptide (TPR) repeat protein
MDYQLKPISRNAIPEALQKAERYRLLNEPAQAESICQDILGVDPQNQQALVNLLLAITDQFGHGGSVPRAREVLRRIEGRYEKAYYGGIIWERTARAQMGQGSPNSAFTAYDGFRRAMECYEEAESLRPSGNDDAILRWNCCARTLMQNTNLRPRPDEAFEAVQGE